MESPFSIIFWGVSGVQLISIRKDKFSPTIEYDICIPGTHLHDMD